MPRQSESTLAAIKQAIDIVALVGEYLPLQRSGAKYRALCPFHDDHNPSLEVNPERQSYKCWSCGAGGDVFDFVQSFERVDFGEALRMLADRAGLVLEAPTGRHGPAGDADGPGKSDLLSLMAWAAGLYAKALERSSIAQLYLTRRGVSAASVTTFNLGFAPDQRDWIQTEASRAGWKAAWLEAAGLIARSEQSGLARDRFRGRLIFPIRDLRGRVLAFGGRVLPEIEAAWTAQGHQAAKYVNSPETLVFHKRRQLYAADLARPEARQQGWVAVVEGYTDVIAAHQAGVTNVVGTLGTALGEDHLTALKRLTDRVILIFDGDTAGQKAADRSLELFLGHALDVRVLTLPTGQDPCDVIQAEGGEAFRARLEQAGDPLDFAIDRAVGRFDIDSPEGARQAAQEVLAVLARMPVSHTAGLEMKSAKALDTLARRLRIPVRDLHQALNRQRQPARPRPPRLEGVEAEVDAALDVPRLSSLDPIDRELVELVLNEPALITGLRGRAPVEFLHEPLLRAILQTAYELDAEGVLPTFDRVSLRLGDPALRSLAASLLLPLDPAPMMAGTTPAPPSERLAAILGRLAERQWRQRIRDLQAAKAEIDPTTNPDDFRALQREYLRVLNQRPVTQRS